MMRAVEVHAQIGAAWPGYLAQLGIPRQYLRKKAGPCPNCGGTDRFTFDNRHQRGDFFCRHCGAGDGFALLMRVHGWSFSEAFARVVQAVGLQDRQCRPEVAQPIRTQSPAQAPRRVWSLLRERCQVADCNDAVEYLAHRGLWPLPDGCTLRAHPSVEYFDNGQRLGRFPALIAAVRDIDDAVVSAHVTFLHQGRKLSPHESRKLLSPLIGRAGCAARLLPLVGDTLGVGEGIETCLAAARIHSMPVWAALNTALLSRFELPPEVRHVVIFADRDAAGLEAAAHLAERLQGRISFEIKPPPAPAKDWADQFITQERYA